MSSWKIAGKATKAAVQAALLAHDAAEGWDAEFVIGGSEVAEGRPDEWVIEGWLPRRPTAADRRALAGLFAATAPALAVERLAERDWVTESQLGLDPIRAGRFHIRTPDHAPMPGAVDLVIPASQAFGTGQHETTAGCLAMLDLMKRRGVVARKLADIGTGTGLLAFAALRLWPRALATASDIDPVCARVVADNASANGVALGDGPGGLIYTNAAGMDDPLLKLRGPYDLLIANILAAPLVELARDFSDAMTPGGNLLLAGLLETQERSVRRAYRRAGFRLALRLTSGDWSILWLRTSRIR